MDIIADIPQDLGHLVEKFLLFSSIKGANFLQLDTEGVAEDVLGLFIVDEWSGLGVSGRLDDAFLELVYSEDISRYVLVQRSQGKGKKNKKKSCIGRQTG